MNTPDPLPHPANVETLGGPCIVCDRRASAPIHDRELVRDRYRIERALAIDHGLSLKTISFLDSLGARILEENRPLTDAQGSVLERILEEHDE